MNLQQDLPDPKKKRHMVLFHILPVILEHPMTHMQLLQALKRQCGVKGCVKAPEGIFAGWIAKLVKEGALVETESHGEHACYSLREDFIEMFALLEGESVPRGTEGGWLRSAVSTPYQRVLRLCTSLGRARRRVKAD